MFFCTWEAPAFFLSVGVNIGNYAFVQKWNKNYHISRDLHNMYHIVLTEMNSCKYWHLCSQCLEHKLKLSYVNFYVPKQTDTLSNINRDLAIFFCCLSCSTILVILVNKPCNKPTSKNHKWKNVIAATQPCLCGLGFSPWPQGTGCNLKPINNAIMDKVSALHCNYSNVITCFLCSLFTHRCEG